MSKYIVVVKRQRTKISQKRKEGKEERRHREKKKERGTKLRIMLMVEIQSMTRLTNYIFQLVLVALK